MIFVTNAYWTVRFLLSDWDLKTQKFLWLCYAILFFRKYSDTFGKKNIFISVERKNRTMLTFCGKCQKKSYNANEKKNTYLAKSATFITFQFQ